MDTINQFGKGALIAPIALRDFRLELAGAVLLPSQFSVKDKVGTIKNQNGSSSCVGQAFSYYVEVLNTIETGQKTALSARDIYSLIYQPQGGSFLKDAANKVCNSGVIPESEASSYQEGNPPSEVYMRSRNDINDQKVEDGKTYLSRKYLTFANNNVEMFKQAIYQGQGCVVACQGNNICWQGEQITTPGIGQSNWAHAIYLCGYDDLTKNFIFVNSWSDKWGNGGFGLLPYSYVASGLVSNPFTLVDVPNAMYISLMSIIKNLKDIIAKLLTKK